MEKKNFVAISTFSSFGALRSFQLRLFISCWIVATFPLPHRTLPIPPKKCSSHFSLPPLILCLLIFSPFPLFEPSVMLSLTSIPQVLSSTGFQDHHIYGDGHCLFYTLATIDPSLRNNKIFTTIQNLPTSPPPPPPPKPSSRSPLPTASSPPASVVGRAPWMNSATAAIIRFNFSTRLLAELLTRTPTLNKMRALEMLQETADLSQHGSNTSLFYHVRRQELQFSIAYIAYYRNGHLRPQETAIFTPKTSTAVPITIQQNAEITVRKMSTPGEWLFEDCSMEDVLRCQYVIVHTTPDPSKQLAGHFDLWSRGSLNPSLSITATSNR